METASVIVIASFGSLGDLHPFLALGQELRRRGHTVRVATTPFYRERIEALGFEFRPLGPPVSPEDPALLHTLMRTARGPEYLIRRLFLPHLPEIYRDLEAACVGAQLLVAGEVLFVAPLLAEKTGIPWVSVLLSPISFLSKYDPPVMPLLGSSAALSGLPPIFHRVVLGLARGALRRWQRPLAKFRKELGLPPQRDGLVRGKFSADLVLALFSKHFAAAQRDWPAATVQPGFVFFEQGQLQQPTGPAGVQAARLEAFLQAGKPPVVFTLGSAAVHAPGNFFHMSAEAAQRLKLRAVLIAGHANLRELETPDILVIPYADYRQLFPRVGAVVHQGGIGTTAEALRAGVPSLVVAFNFDQPDNAARVQRLGVGVSLPRRRYNRRHAHYALHRLLRDAGLRDKAGELAGKIQAEDGLSAAADAVEKLLAPVLPDGPAARRAVTL